MALGPLFSQARPNKGLGGKGRAKKRSHEDAAEAKKSILKIGEGQVPKNHHFLVFVAIALNGKNPSGNHFLTINLKVIPAWVLGIMVFDAFCKKTELDPGLYSTRAKRQAVRKGQYQKSPGR